MADTFVLKIDDKKVSIPKKMYGAITRLHGDVPSFKLKYKVGINTYSIVSQDVEEEEAEPEQPEQTETACEESETEEAAVVMFSIGKDDLIFDYDEFWSKITAYKGKLPSKNRHMKNFSFLDLDSNLMVRKTKDSLLIEYEDLCIHVSPEMLTQLLAANHPFMDTSPKLLTILRALLD